MRKLTHHELVEQRLTEAQVASTPRHPVIIVLDDVRSLYNVGSIFRSADAFRIQQLVLTGYTPTPPRKEISKTALGADATVPWVYIPTAIDAVTTLKSAGCTALAVELTVDAQPLENLSVGTNPVVLILGNELTGVKQEVLDLCDGAVMIPMHGVKHSLNVAVAAGIAMYEAVRLMA